MSSSDDGKVVDGEHPRPRRRMPDEPDPQRDTSADEQPPTLDDDPESPGATIDTDDPAEPNEPG